MLIYTPPHSSSRCLDVRQDWCPMYYPEGMKARVSPVQLIEPYRILAPTRDLNQEPPDPQSRVVTTILPLHIIVRPRNSQSFDARILLQPLNHLCSPPLDLLQFINILHALRSPSLHTAVQMWPHYWLIQRQHDTPWICNSLNHWLLQFTILWHLTSKSAHFLEELVWMTMEKFLRKGKDWQDLWWLDQPNLLLASFTALLHCMSIFRLFCIIRQRSFTGMQC